MAITTQAGLVTALNSSQDINFTKASITTVTTLLYSLWAAGGSPAAGSLSIGNTANGLVPTDATTGAMPIQDAGSGQTLYLVDFNAASGGQGSIMLFDRLWHVGSISATALATTTLSSVPTFATRVPGANYGEVMMFLEIRTTFSATATTVTVSYTNQSGTAGKSATSELTSLTGVAASRLVPMRLATGDSGVQSVQSITVGGTVATAGAFNVVLARKLAAVHSYGNGYGDPRQDAIALNMPIVYTDSCLWLVTMTASTSSNAISGEICIASG